MHVDTFNWNQTYGPLRWPQNGHEVLAVRGRQKSGDYWKAEDLDTFNGYSWVAGIRQPQPPLLPPSGDALARWTQTLHVSIVGMKTPDVIAAGEAGEPLDRYPAGSPQGDDQGTWQSRHAAGPGDELRALELLAASHARTSWRPPDATTRPASWTTT